MIKQMLYVTNNICETMCPFEMPRMFAFLLLFFFLKRKCLLCFFCKARLEKQGPKPTNGNSSASASSVSSLEPFDYSFRHIFHPSYKIGYLSILYWIKCIDLKSCFLQPLAESCGNRFDELNQCVCVQTIDVGLVSVELGDVN